MNNQRPKPLYKITTDQETEVYSITPLKTKRIEDAVIETCFNERTGVWESID